MGIRGAGKQLPRGIPHPESVDGFLYERRTTLMEVASMGGKELLAELEKYYVLYFGLKC